MDDESASLLASLRALVQSLASSCFIRTSRASALAISTVWFPGNYVLIESLRQFHCYYGDDFTVECPTGSGQYLTLNQVADFLAERLLRIFKRGEDGTRPFNGDNSMLQTDPHWRDHILFYEYFHGDTGMGLGANHQTGWTALVTRLLSAQQ